MSNTPTIKKKASSKTDLEKNFDHSNRTLLKKAGITCVGFNLRKASRMVTRFFDDAFEPLGLRSTQFAILAAIGRHKGLSHSRLADLLVMDRTTLTRSIKPLENMGWTINAESSDKRKRLVKLSTSGYKILNKALPIWENAQVKILEDMGDEDSRQLLKFLWRYVYGKRYLDA